MESVDEEVPFLEFIRADVQMIRQPVPKYHYLRETLREEIQNWQANEQIPSESELCTAYQVSRTTVRKALDHLIFDGLLYRVQGKGTFVSPSKVMGRFVSTTSGFWDDARSQGLNMKTHILEQTVIPADSSLAHALHLERGSLVFKLVRLRFIDHLPLMVTPAYVPYHLCQGIVTENFENQSFYRVLQEKYGIVIDHGTQLIEARPCGPDDADLLEIEPGTPLLVTIGTMCNQDDVPVEYSVAKSRWDRLRCEVKFITPPA